MLRWVISAVLYTLAGCAPAPLLVFAAPLGSRATLGFEQHTLMLHNAERARVGVAPLAWDSSLAAAARGYAARLAPMQRLVHSSKLERGQTGENLWMGTRGYFRVEAMVGSWTAERRFFRPGIFPRNSRTGNWADVGHYTAMIWPTTTRVGCGIAVAGDNEVLVCRYAPNGNIDGRRVP